MNVKKLFYRYPQEIFLFFTTLFIRFPFFFRDYIDRDESTFILMGQSIADGHLPYDHLWDLKPPLLFYFFALIEKIFPHSFVALRFFGVLIIFLSALILLKIAKQANLKNGFLIALGYVLLSSEFGSLQGVMSEHFAVFFLLLGLLFFLRKKKITDFLIVGMAWGCAILCKLSFAYAIALLFVFYLLDNYGKRNLKQNIFQLLISGAGILIPVILIAIPFVIAGKINLFINSVFLAPLKYASASDQTWIDKLKTSWWIIVITAVVAWLSSRASKKENQAIVFASIAILIGTVYTFYSSGIVNGHYLVQVYPFFLILFFGVLLPKTIQLKFGLLAIVVLLLSFESVLEYARLIKATKNFPEYRPTFEVINELKKRKLDNSRIFFAEYHISYWLLHQYPLTKSTTHPSNLGRPYLFPYYNNPRQTSLDELKYILDDLKPDVIVSQVNGLEFFPDTSTENIYFKKSLDSNYGIIYQNTTHRIYIWERQNK